MKSDFLLQRCGHRIAEHTRRKPRQVGLRLRVSAQFRHLSPERFFKDETWTSHSGEGRA
jgi:hypothetical protein